MLLREKLLNLSHHLDHVWGGGATNHDLKIIPRQVAVHVDFSVHWFTLLFKQVIWKEKSKITTLLRRIMDEGGGEGGRKEGECLKQLEIPRKWSKIVQKQLTLTLALVQGLLHS